jgi:hypothetical protein
MNPERLSVSKFTNKSDKNPEGGKLDKLQKFAKLNAEIQMGISVLLRWGVLFRAFNM